MSIFHDILLWDEHGCIDETYTQRRRYLHDLVEPILGLERGTVTS
jgi:ATP-dependent DNA ligase